MEEARVRDMLLRGMLTAIRDGHDADWCRRRLVKPLKRLLKAPTDARQFSPEMERVRKEFADSLDKFCSLCPLEGCRGKKPGEDCDL